MLKQVDAHELQQLYEQERAFEHEEEEGEEEASDYYDEDADDTNSN